MIRVDVVRISAVDVRFSATEFAFLADLLRTVLAVNTFTYSYTVIRRIERKATLLRERVLRRVAVILL